MMPRNENALAAGGAAQGARQDHGEAVTFKDSTAPEPAHVYRPGTRVCLDLIPGTVWILVRNDGRRAVVRHPRGGTLAVPSSRVWLAGEVLHG